MHLQITGAFKVVAKASCFVLLCSTTWKWVMMIIYRVSNLINFYALPTPDSLNLIEIHLSCFEANRELDF